MEENTLNTQSVEFEYGNKTVKIETGKIARQATSVSYTHLRAHET